MLSLPVTVALALRIRTVSSSEGVYSFFPKPLKMLGEFLGWVSKHREVAR